MQRRLVLLLLLVLCSPAVHAIAYLPGKASSSKDSNLVLIDGHWRKIDFDKQFSKGRPHPPVGDAHLRSDAPVVVLIAALRETRLANTVQSFFVNATYPDRVSIAIVQQNDPHDEDIVVEYCKLMGAPVTKRVSPGGQLEFSPVAAPCPHVDQLRVLRMLESEAQGPAYARALGATLVADSDEFCMQIDAHTVVVQGWDTKLLGEWAATENEFAVLSTYPSNVHHLGANINNHWEMPHLCCVTGNRGIIVNCQAKATAAMDRPILAPFWAAGLSFSKCHAERLVPNDINLKGVFAGEEYGRGVRLWTHGYDFYSISRPIVGTYYGGEKGGRGGWHTPHEDLQNSHKRLATLVGAEGADMSEKALRRLGKYGLGRRRTLEQYIEFTGIDPRHSGPHKAHCAVVYQPWKDPGGVYVPWVEPPTLAPSAPTLSAKSQAAMDKLGELLKTVEVEVNKKKKKQQQEEQNNKVGGGKMGVAAATAAAAATAITTRAVPVTIPMQEPPLKLKMRGKMVGPGTGFVARAPSEMRDPSMLFVAVPIALMVFVLWIYVGRTAAGSSAGTRRRRR